MKHEGYNTNNYQPSYKIKFSAKELQDELGLNMYDMEARNYMPDLGRWANMDELSEDFYEWSPYNFSFNNPINFSDPSGLAPEGSNNWASTFVRNGVVIEHRNDGDDNIYQVDYKWKPGGSKEGLQVIGKEIPGMDYIPGYRVNMINGYGVAFNRDHSVNSMGGPFDLFGFWEGLWNAAFEVSDEIGSPNLAFMALLLSRGKVNPKKAVGLLPKLLNIGKTHRHHVLSQQFRKWFASRGISNIDDYTIQISAKNHLSKLHGQGKWNKQWETFITQNPNATPSQIFHQAESMLKSFGLEHAKYVPYK